MNAMRKKILNCITNTIDSPEYKKRLIRRLEQIDLLIKDIEDRQRVTPEMMERKSIT